MAIHLGDGVFNLKGDMTHLVATMGASKRAIGLGMAAIGGAVVMGFAKSVKSAATFEQAITNAASVTGKTGAAFDETRDKMEKLAKVMARDTKFSAHEVANAMYDLASKGFDVANMTKGELIPIFDLAAATQSDLAQATQLVTGTLRGFGLQNKDTTRIADVFAKAIGTSAAKMELFSTSMPIVSTTMKLLNLSLEETVAILSKLYDREVDASTAATGLRNVMQDLLAQKKPIVDAFARYEISLKDIDIAGSSVAEVFTELVKRGLTAQQALVIFGKKSGTVAAAMTDAMTEINAFTGELDKAGGTARTVAEIQLQTLEGQTTLLKSSFGLLGLALGKVFIPTLMVLTKAITRVLNAFVRWIDLHPVWFKALAGLTALASIAAIAIGIKLALGIGAAAAALAGMGTAAGVAGVGLGLALGPFLLWITAAAVAAIAIYKVSEAIIDLGKAREGLRQSEERLAAQQKLLHEQEKRLLDDELKQRTGFSTKAIELIEKQVQAAVGATMTREQLVQRIIEINKDHTMSVTALIEALKGEVETGADAMVESTDKIDTSYKESMKYKAWAYGKTAEYIAQQVSQQTGLRITTQQVLEGMSAMEDDKARSTQDMIQIMSTAVTSGATTWKGAFTKMAKATEEETAKISGDLGRVSEQIAALQRQMMQMGGASWWMDIWNNMTAATNRWQKYFGQSIAGALGSLRTLKSGSETIMGSFGFPSPAVETIMGGGVRGFGTTVVPSSISDAMLAQLVGGGAGVTINVSGNQFTADDFSESQMVSLVEQLADRIQEEGWARGVSLG